MNVGLSYIVQIMGGEDTADQTNAADRAAGLTGGIVRGFIAQTFRQIIAAIAAGYHTEHNTDDSHKTIHATGALYERSRTTAIGDWTDVSFAAGNYTAAGSMTWTVTSGQQVVFAYLRIGTTLYVNFWIESSTLGGTVSTTARLTLPASLVAGQYASHPIHYVNSGSGIGFARVLPGDRYLSLFKGDSSAWTAGALTVHGQMALKVAESTTVTAVTTVLTYSGAASGAVNFAAVTTLSLTTTGTYTITVSTDMTLTLKGVAGGGGGASATNASGAAGGGGGGGETSTGTTVSLLANKTYTLIVGAGGAAGVDGGVTSFVNTTDTVTLLSLVAGVHAGVPPNNGIGGTGGTGSNRVAGGTGGPGSASLGVAGGNGANATNGAGGGGGGGAAAAGGNGGNGSATGGTGGALNTAGGNNGGLAGGGGGATANSGGGGGGGGGTQFANVSGAYGGGGGGGALPNAGGTATGGTGLNGQATFVFVSVP